MRLDNPGSDDDVRANHRSVDGHRYASCGDAQIDQLLAQFRLLRSRLLEKKKLGEATKYSEHRRALIGGGGREEKIRTYNYPQNRVTDHRINLTLYKIDDIMDGDLTELLDALAQEHQAEQLAAGGGHGALHRFGQPVGRAIPDAGGRRMSEGGPALASEDLRRPVHHGAHGLVGGGVEGGDGTRGIARAAGVSIVAGDTKVVERGKADGLYVTTAGVGIVADGVDRPVRGPGAHGALNLLAATGAALGGATTEQLHEPVVPPATWAASMTRTSKPRSRQYSSIRCLIRRAPSLLQKS